MRTEPGPGPLARRRYAGGVTGETFDLVLNLFTSFGYFADEADDRRVIRAAASMLEPGGRFLLEVINGQRVMGNFEEREWFTVGQIAVWSDDSSMCRRAEWLSSGR